MADEIERLRSRNSQLRAEVDALRSYVDTLQELLDALNQPKKDSDVMAALASGLEGARSVLGAEQGALLVFDDERDELVVVLSTGADEHAAWSRSRASAGLSGWVLRHREAIIVNDVPADERFDANADQLPGASTVTLLAVPVVGHDAAMGVLRIANKGGRGIFDEEDQTLLSMAGRFAGELLLRMARRHAADGGT